MNYIHSTLPINLFFSNVFQKGGRSGEIVEILDYKLFWIRNAVFKFGFSVVRNLGEN